MSDAVELPEAPVPADIVPSAVPAEVRLANTASIASAITGVTGLSGGGKSSLADTAAEYAWDVHGKQTLCYAIDPGGFGTKRVALIRGGIMQVWDPRNHVNYFETMELATLGAWPEVIEDPERGYADPNVRLILPRRLVVEWYCPAGHVAKRFDSLNSELEAVIVSNAGGVSCATCGMLTSMANASKVERLIVRHRMFRNVGLRIYDSITAMNDAGLIIELPTMSANNKFSKGKEGGAALGSADAFKQGSVSYGTGSEAQVGFMQNRTYGWLMNIRQLPDVVVPTICTFGIEESKTDIAAGGLQVLGPRIAGKARTSAVPGWVGNLVYASHEPEDLPKGTTTSPNMVFRLWLTTHTDPRDSRRMPILAKHRGTPLGIDYLEDPWDADPAKRKANAWKGCSLATLFRMLDQQVAEEEAALRVKYPDAPGFVEAVDPGPVDDVIGTVGARAIVTGPVVGAPAGQTGAGGAIGGGVVGQGAPPAAQVAGLPRVPRKRGGAPVALGVGTGAGLPPVAVPAVAVTPAMATAVGMASNAAAAVVPAPEPEKSIVQQQLEASVAQIDATKKAEAPASTVSAQPAPPTASVPAPSPVSTPTALGATTTPPPAQPAQPATAATGAPRVVRRPRPPVS